MLSQSRLLVDLVPPADFDQENDVKSTRAIDRALDALDGLSVGDAFGEQFFVEEPEGLIRDRTVPKPPWFWTDDTAMAISLLPILLRYGAIEQDLLASSFGITYRYDSRRGYGAAMHQLLPEYLHGTEWRKLAPALFGGQGSFGNGAAMRVAPIGAYFADDLGAVVHQAALSAEITHAHPEAAAGAIAVAVATAIACTTREEGEPISQADYLASVLAEVPDSEVRRRLTAAARLSPLTTITEAVEVLGNGSGITAQDTVPFCVWCASQHLDDFEGALWQTVAGLGDRDTTCAIVGGIVGARGGLDSIPPRWFASREPLPHWVYERRR